ncbi:DegQ family serine endoprotease [Desulforhabdus amnigena]|uniref:Probable periplasmic serine endoprotease DegP-like n=1 Tax=Desulforhabdus amnigena TaxID=40218 RepID=A0A9W6FTK3_9BACT|nr:DegQ family serine endoprotease [Desulforhabdus amnigena]NLJ27066.1 DegQ family serine endoprotease [Deltaproteobacteria bacterium]GLI34130.1 peptidase [Desulforhabdus amnigena]
MTFHYGKSVARGRASLMIFIALMMLAVSLHLSPSAFASLGTQGPPSFADLAEQVNHTVVNISTTQVIKDNPMQPFMSPNSPFREFFGDEFFKKFFGGEMPQGEMKTHALGSGFIIDSEGLILTNNHVVEKADEIKIKTQDGKEYDAKVVGRDPKTDLALIRVKTDKDFPAPAELGDSGSIRVGDWVMAVGNPFGLGNTVTAGIVSAKGRIIGAGPYDDFIQTDAAINPGNSGGPLFNMRGEVVGINTAIVAQGQGIGFAIPVNVAKELIPQLKSGKIIRGWLGVMIQDITPELAESFGIKEKKGVIVGDVVPDGAADKAGIKRGDVITRFDGKEVDNAHTLSRLVAITPPDSKVNVQIVRDGKAKEITVVIGTMPDETQEAEPEAKKSAWGLTVQNITPDLAQRFGWDENERGVVISGIEPGSPAAEAQLRMGDLIKEANRQKIQNMRDYSQIVKVPKKGETLLLLVKRGQNTFYVALKATD